MARLTDCPYEISPKISGAILRETIREGILEGTEGLKTNGCKNTRKAA